MKTPIRRITRQYYNYFYSKYINMFKKLALSYSYSQEEFDDYCDIAFQELLYAMIYYDTNRKTKLTTFVYARVHGKIRTARSKNQKYNSRFNRSFKPSIVPSFYEDTYLDNPIFIEELLFYLTPVERNVLLSHYMEGKSWEEIAEEIDKSQATVHTIKKKGLNKVRKQFVCEKQI